MVLYIGFSQTIRCNPLNGLLSNHYFVAALGRKDSNVEFEEIPNVGNFICHPSTLHLILPQCWN